MVKVVKVTGSEVLDESTYSVSFRSGPRSDQELIDHDLGIEASLAGRRKDTTRSKAWQRGWADAQEHREVLAAPQPSFQRR